MRDLFNNPKVKLYGSLLGLLVVINILFYLYRLFSPDLPKIISTSPLASGDISLEQVFTTTFDQDLEISSLKVVSDPPVNFILEQISPKTIRLNHPINFQPSTIYNLSFTYQERVVGTLSFKTIASQTDSLLLYDMMLELERDYPLGQKTPYEAPGFRIVYSAPLTLEITLKNSSLDDLEAISYARAWVSENGLDPSTHKYVLAD